MTVTVSMTFATLEEATAFLTGKPAAAPAPTPAPKATQKALPAPVEAAPAPTPPTVEVEAVAAPATKAIDFDTEVVDALRAYSKRVDPADFKTYMASLKIAKVNDLKSKPDMWAAIVAHCNG